jgi:hypothetical protein
MAYGLYGTRRWDVAARGFKALPEHLMTVVPKVHAQTVEVPKNWPKRAQERHTKHHVVAVQRNCEAVDEELLLTDADRDVARQDLARHLVAIRDADVCTLTALETKTGTVAGGAADEVGGGAGIEEHREVLGAQRDAHLHRVFAAYPGDGIRGDERLVFLGGQRVIHEVGDLIIRICHLQVEEAGALVAADIWFVPVVA